MKALSILESLFFTIAISLMFFTFHLLSIFLCVCVFVCFLVLGFFFSYYFARFLPSFLRLSCGDAFVVRRMALATP